MRTHSVPTLARDRQIPALCGENRLQNGKNDASDGDLAIPCEQITAEGFPPRCTSSTMSHYALSGSVTRELKEISVIFPKTQVTDLLGALIE